MYFRVLFAKNRTNENFENHENCENCENKENCENGENCEPKSMSAMNYELFSAT